MSRIGEVPDKILRKGDGRLNLVIDSELKEWALRFASSRRTSLSGLVSFILLDLKRREDAPSAEQI